jgi:hypothetical protein
VGLRRSPRPEPRAPRMERDALGAPRDVELPQPPARPARRRPAAAGFAAPRFAAARDRWRSGGTVAQASASSQAVTGARSRPRARAIRAAPPRAVHQAWTRCPSIAPSCDSCGSESPGARGRQPGAVQLNATPPVSGWSGSRPKCPSFVEKLTGNSRAKRRKTDIDRPGPTTVQGQRTSGRPRCAPVLASVTELTYFTAEADA